MQYWAYISRFCAVLGALILFTSTAFSQTTRIDSLKVKLEQFDREKAAMGSAFPKMRDTLRADILSSLSIAYSHTDPDTSLKYATEQMALSEKLGYKFGIANACELQAFVHEHRGRYEEALKLLNRARTLYLEGNSPGSAINVDNGIGVQYAKKGLYSEALKYLFRALNDAKKANDNWGLMGTYNNIGLVYTKQKEYDHALTYYNESIKVLMKLKDKRGLPYTYMNMGELYGLENRPMESVKYFKLGIESAIKTGDDIALASNYCGLGILRMKQEEYGPAEELLLKALGTVKRLDDRGGMFTTYLSLGEVYFKTGEKQKGLEYTLIAADIVKDSGEFNYSKDTYNQLSEIYAGLGNYRLAYENHKLYKQYNDSVFNAENKQMLTEQRMNFEFKGIQEKKDLAAKTALQRQKNIRNASAGGLAVVAVVIIFLLMRRHKKGNAKKQQAYASLHEKFTVKDIEAKALKVENENIELKNRLMAKEKQQEMREREKLLEKLDFNRRELASATLYLYQKNELLSGLKAEIEALSQGEASAQQISKIKSTIQQNLYMDADWDKFKLHFEQVHPDFFKELNEKHPGLTAYEVRLCAYLHLKLSTKEIAALLNITPASVTKAKVRLNKKLNRTEVEEMAG